VSEAGVGGGGEVGSDAVLVGVAVAELAPASADLVTSAMSAWAVA